MAQNAKTARASTSLLEQPIHQILAAIRDEQPAPATAPVEPQPLTEANLAQIDVKGKGKAKPTNLWTDKYKPKKFTDLLGDDVRLSSSLLSSACDVRADVSVGLCEQRVNRSAMAWLKEWDACVFKTAAAQNAKKKALVEKRKRAREEQAGLGGISSEAVRFWPSLHCFETVLNRCAANRWKIRLGDRWRRSCY